jgi:fumarate reductase subunit D
MKKLLLTLSIIMLGFGITAGLSMPAYARATKQDVCSGIGATVGAEGCSNGSGKSVDEIVAMVINVFSWIVGAVAVIFAIYAGFLYITSGGEQGKIKLAKDTIFYVIVGLVVVAISQVLVNFVLKKVT